MHVKIVPFVLIYMDVCEYPIYLLWAFLCFWRCIENESIKIFYKYVWANSIAIRKENEVECVFTDDCVMFEDFLNESDHVDKG